MARKRGYAIRLCSLSEVSQAGTRYALNFSAVMSRLSTLLSTQTSMEYLRESHQPRTFQCTSLYQPMLALSIAKILESQARKILDSNDLCL